MGDEPFGRQPLPVTILFAGEQIDIDYWSAHIKRAISFKGDLFERISATEFRIYPRAVND